MTLETKIVEIRDEGTMIAALCVNLGNPTNPEERWYLRRYGYPCDGKPNIMVTHASLGTGTRASNDPYEWTGRTWPTAHHYIIDHWPELKSGDVVDVSYILGETAVPKKSERFSAP